MKPIQSLWIGDQLSVMEQLCIRSFQKQGHEFHLYTYNRVKNVPEGTVVLDAHKIIPRERVCKCPGVGEVGGSYAPFADLFRYKLISEMGGWWVDMDFVCLRPFDFQDHYVLVGDQNSLTPAVFKVPTPNDPFAMWMYQETEKVFSPTIPWGITGDFVLAGAKKFDLFRYARPTIEFYPVDEARLVAPSLGPENEERVRRAVAIHCYGELWRIAGADKNAHFPLTSLYERLLREHGIR